MTHAVAELVRPDVQVMPSLPDHATREDWRAALTNVVNAHRKTQWLIGELLAFGERKWGDGAYQEAAEITGYSYGELRNIASVVARVSPRADTTLSFSHHREVAALEAPEQERWLDKAEREKWSTRELHDQLRLTRDPVAPSLRIPKCSRCERPCRVCEIEILSEKKKAEKLKAKKKGGG